MADSRPPNPFLLFLRISRPLLLLASVLAYGLGAGIADYLGAYINWNTYLAGQVWVIALLLGSIYLFEYYNVLSESNNPHQNPRPRINGSSGLSRPPVTMLVAAAGSMTAVASLSVLIIRTMHPSPATLLIMGLAALGAISYSVPPVRLAFSGYGELLIALFIANLTPSVAFLLQEGEMHRLLAMSTFPLTALFLSSTLAFELAEYVADLRHNRRTLMVRMGWQRGMSLHNAMLLGTFLLIALAVTFGLPLFIGLPAILTLPLGVLQIWQMRRIADGAKPNWTSLKLTASVLFATTAYLLTFAFWTR
jgi:1,4-dihydroxy-2-naphthoate octaprenyltransferase